MPAAPTWTERHIELPERGEIFVRESPGPPGAPVLLLLHGLAATGLLNWRPALDPLARDYRVLVVDHRGHGQGMRIRAPFRLVDCADDAAALLGVLDLPHVTAVGYSMGGPVAQLLWKRHPDRISGLVLCATAARFANVDRQRWVLAASPLLNQVGRFAPRRFLRRMARHWLKGQIEDPAVRDRILSEVHSSDPVSISQAGAAVLRFDSSDWVSEIDVPTSVVLTERDTIVPAPRQMEMANQIPGAVLHPVAGNHSVCVTHPDRFNAALLKACESVSLRAERRIR